MWGLIFVEADQDEYYGGSRCPVGDGPRFEIEQRWQAGLFFEQTVYDIRVDSIV